MAVTLIAWMWIAVSPAMTPVELAEAHGQGVAALYSIDCTVEVEVRRRNAKSVSPYTLQSRIRWMREGDKERLEGELPDRRIDPEGNLFGREDILRDGHILKVLTNWDWSDPPDIAPSNPRTSRGSVVYYQPETGLSIFDVPMLLLLYPQVGVSYPRVPLAETIRLFDEASIIPCDRHGPAGERVLCIRLSKPRSVKSLAPDDLMEVDIVPDLNFMATRCALIRPSHRMPDATGTLVKCRYEMAKAVRRVEVRGGVVIPVELVSSTHRHDTDERFESARTTVQIRSVNESLPDDAFAFRFPAQLTVTDVTQRDEKGRPLIAVWGPENTPEFQTHDTSELIQRYGARPSSTSVSWLVIALVPAVVLALVWISMRQRGSRRPRSSS